MRYGGDCMIRCFSKSRLAFAACLLLAAVTGALVLPALSGAVWWRLTLTAAVILLAGYSIASIAGNIAASLENNRRMRLLHEQLDPAAFIAAYRTVPEKLSPESADYAICCSYLADGYLANGDFETALSLIRDTYRPTRNKKRNAAIRTLQQACRCNYLLWMERTEASAGALREFRSAVAEAKTVNPALAENMHRRLVEFSCWQRLLEEGTLPAKDAFSRLPICTTRSGKRSRRL